MKCLLPIVLLAMLGCSVPEPGTPADSPPAELEPLTGSRTEMEPEPAKAPPSPKAVSPSAKPLEIGDNAQVETSDHGDVFVAVDDDAWDKMFEAINAKDQLGLAGLVAAGKVLVVRAGTKVQVIKLAVFSTKVRILAGGHIGASGWIPNEFLRPFVARVEPPTEPDRPFAGDMDEEDKTKAAEAQKARPLSLTNQAKALEKINPEAAIRYYREIAETYPESPEAKNAKARIKALTRKRH